MSPEIPRASLASMDPYPVPQGARLVFRYVVFTTDGFMRGDVLLVLQNGGAEHVVAKNVPVTGTSTHAMAMGDFAKLFPEPIAVVASEDED